MQIMSLIKISHFLYFFIIVLFLSFVALDQKTGSSWVQTNIVLLYTILLLPLFDVAYNMLFASYRCSRKSIVSLAIASVIGAIIFFMWYMSVGIVIIMIMAYLIWIGGDARIFFMGALIVFCYIIFYLVFEQSIVAESLSIYAYYLLVAGVGVQIVEQIRSPKIQNS